MPEKKRLTARYMLLICSSSPTASGLYNALRATRPIPPSKSEIYAKKLAIEVVAPYASDPKYEIIIHGIAIPITVLTICESEVVRAFIFARCIRLSICGILT